MLDGLPAVLSALVGEELPCVVSDDTGCAVMGTVWVVDSSFRSDAPPWIVWVSGSWIVPSKDVGRFISDCLFDVLFVRGGGGVVRSEVVSLLRLASLIEARARVFGGDAREELRAIDDGTLVPFASPIEGLLFVGDGDEDR